MTNEVLTTNNLFHTHDSVKEAVDYLTSLPHDLRQGAVMGSLFLMNAIVNAAINGRLSIERAGLDHAVVLAEHDFIVDVDDKPRCPECDKEVNVAIVGTDRWAGACCNMLMVFDVKKDGGQR